MKLYVCSDSESLTENIDGIYFLVAETGEVLASHFCSSKWFAKGDLYERRPERIEKFNERFGECECLFLGEDDMTAKEILELNAKWADDRPEEF